VSPRPEDPVERALRIARGLSGRRTRGPGGRPGRPTHEERLGCDDDRALLARARLRKDLALAERHELRNELLRGEVVRVEELERGWALAMAGLRRVTEKLVELSTDRGRARRVAADGLRAVAEDVARALEEAHAAARGSA